jgi:hypothetical protein
MAIKNKRNKKPKHKKMLRNQDKLVEETFAWRRQEQKRMCRSGLDGLDQVERSPSLLRSRKRDGKPSLQTQWASPSPKGHRAHGSDEPNRTVAARAVAASRPLEDEGFPSRGCAVAGHASPCRLPPLPRPRPDSIPSTSRAEEAPWPPRSAPRSPAGATTALGRYPRTWY